MRRIVSRIDDEWCINETISAVYLLSEFTESDIYSNGFIFGGKLIRKHTKKKIDDESNILV